MIFPEAAYDYQESYLRAIFGYMGLTDLTFIHADNLNAGDEARNKSLDAVHEAIAQAVANW